MVRLSIGAIPLTFDYLGDRVHSLDCEYEASYKTLFQFLEAHPDFRFFFFFSGSHLEHYKKHHEEFFPIIKDLLERDQIELLGGGYYNPLFPLTFPRERTAQLEDLNNFLRDNLGKRPRGAYLPLSAWDSSLLSAFVTTGFDYILLSYPAIKKTFPSVAPNPLIMRDKAKSLKILPYFNKLDPAGRPVHKWLDDVLGEYASIEGSATLTYLLTIGEIASLIKSGFLDDLSGMLSQKSFMENVDKSNLIEISRPFDALQSVKKIKPVYIPTAFDAKKGCEDYFSVFNLIACDKPSSSLYNRTTFETLLLNQNRLCRATKDAARKFVLEAQSVDPYLVGARGGLSAFKFLNMAERVLHNDRSFKSSISKFDYDGSGNLSYIIRTKEYFCVLDKNGVVTEFSALRRPSTNFTLEGFLFFESISGVGVPGFSTYCEDKFSFSYTKEVFLRAVFVAEDLGGLNLIIKKKIIAVENSMTIQYIIKNDSGKAVDTVFSVKNLLSKDALITFECVISDNTVEQLPKGRKSFYTFSTALDATSSDGRVSLIFEPNEPCTVKSDGENDIALEWPLNLAPFGETEKTINFYVLNMHNKR